MPNPDSKLNIKFNIQLDLETDEQLIALADFLHIKKSQCIRHLIRAGFQMHIQQIPTCASCEACRAPHTFTYVNQPAPASPPRGQPDYDKIIPLDGDAEDPPGVDPKVAYRG